MNLAQRKAVDDNKVLLAEFGTLSLEFRRLSALTGDRTYARRVERVYEQVESKLNYTKGLLPLTISCGCVRGALTAARGPRDGAVPRECVQFWGDGRFVLRVPAEGLVAEREARCGRNGEML